MAVDGPTSSSAGGYGFGALLLAASTSALGGLYLGYQLAGREAQGDARVSRLPKRCSDSLDSPPGATPRSLSRTDSARGGGGGPRLALLVRTDLPMGRAELAQHAARVVLGQFKKCHKRRDPGLHAWEEGGHAMRVLGVGSQADMLLVQAAARTRAIPTHTFAGMSKEEGRGQRTVMAVGPAPADQLDEIIHSLRELA